MAFPFRSVIQGLDHQCEDHALHQGEQEDRDPGREIEPRHRRHQPTDRVEDGRGRTVDELDGRVRQIKVRDPAHDDAREKEHVQDLKREPDDR